MRSPAAFFDRIADAAIESTQGTGLLPSIAMAQAALESGYGKSALSNPPYNNLFGIKARRNEPSVAMPTWEVRNGQNVTEMARFRVFDSLEDSFRQRVRFLQARRYKKVLAATKPNTQARALQEAGYATDPNYARKLIAIVDTHKLEQYDVVAKKKERTAISSTQVS